eukprot:16451006-Heterocapsa_arctica.AAC.1
MAWHCLLRIGETISTRCGNISFSPGAVTGVLRLQQTKSGLRFGNSESVVVDDPRLCTFLARYEADREPGNPFCPKFLGR